MTLSEKLLLMVCVVSKDTTHTIITRYQLKPYENSIPYDSRDNESGPLLLTVETSECCRFKVRVSLQQSGARLTHNDCYHSWDIYTFTKT